GLLAGARRACEHDDLGYFNWSLAELVEAGVRSGAVEEAAAAPQKLEGRTPASGTDWALGVLARSKALLSDDAAAESLYRDAIQRLERGVGDAATPGALAPPPAGPPGRRFTRGLAAPPGGGLPAGWGRGEGAAPPP